MRFTPRWRRRAISGLKVTVITIFISLPLGVAREWLEGFLLRWLSTKWGGIVAWLLEIISHPWFPWALVPLSILALVLKEFLAEDPNTRAIRQRFEDLARRGTVLLATVTGAATPKGMGVNDSVIDEVEKWGIETYKAAMEYSPAEGAEFFPMQMHRGEPAQKSGMAVVDEFMAPMWNPRAEEVEAFLRQRLIVIQRILRELKERR